VREKSGLLTYVDEQDFRFLHWLSKTRLDVYKYSLAKTLAHTDHSRLAMPLTAPLNLPISKEQLDEINAQLNLFTPEEILQWGLKYLPGLHQTTAFGLTGLVAIDMQSKFTKSPPPLIFLDTLYHFPETYELVEEVKKRYGVPVHVYRPDGCKDAKEFEEKYGQRLWETDEDTYDFVVKVQSTSNYLPDVLLNLTN
jgi:3'-phosphoadenosine 5'-phosphosulfate sulfotransferase (PAPS reductase)/FAD synthetase